MSKTKKVLKTRQKIIDLVSEYGQVAYGWNCKKEGDIEDFENALDQILEKIIE